MLIPRLLLPASSSPAPAPVGASPAPEGAPVTLSAPANLQRNCKKCGAPMAGAQDWCLRCGAGAPDSLVTNTPSWRSAAAILGVLAILVAGAATAAYAALSKAGKKPPPTTVATVAQLPGGAAARRSPAQLGPARDRENRHAHDRQTTDSALKTAENTARHPRCRNRRLR